MANRNRTSSDALLAQRATETALPHGGRLRLAAHRYGIPLESWIDLSTGINPHSWPVGELPQSCWLRLPEEEDGLEEAARNYYGAAHLLPVCGSQAAIQTLPTLRAPGHVAVIAPGYAEHAHGWRRAGHQMIPTSADKLEEAATQADVLVIIRPNNPTGAHFRREQLLRWHEMLTARGGWLIVDEAFMDATPEESLAPFSDRAGLVVLRSLGKFFGLAGARVGFVLAAPPLLDALADHLGPWSVAGPSRVVAAAALQDKTWHTHMRTHLQAESARLAALLSRHGLHPHGGTPLFQWVQTDHAPQLHDALARRAILTRLFDTPASLRFGLPADESQWQRLEQALRETMESACAA